VKNTPIYLLVFLVLGFLDAGAQGVIGTSDEVSVKVFREADLDTLGEVSPAGTLTIPLLGPVKIAGLSPVQAEKVIEARLRDGYLVRPQVSVAIVKRVVRTVTVLGQARQPGVFTLPDNRKLTLLEAIGMAGGLTEIANERKVRLKSGRTGATRIVDVKRIMDGKSADITLSSGDIINIPESWF
jgi:polysaccharide export outer membrane protein